MLLALALPAAPASGSPVAVPAVAFSVAASLHESPTVPFCVAEARGEEREGSVFVARPRQHEGDLEGVRAVQSPGSGVPALLRSPAGFLTGRLNE